MIQNQDQRMLFCIRHKATALFTKPVLLVIAASSTLKLVWHLISYSVSLFWMHCFLFPVIRDTMWGVVSPPRAQWFVWPLPEKAIVHSVGRQGSSVAGRARQLLCLPAGRGRPRMLLGSPAGPSTGCRAEETGSEGNGQAAWTLDPVVVEQSFSFTTKLLPQWWHQRVNTVIPVTESKLILFSVWFFSSLFFCIFYIIQLCLLDLF